MVRRILIVMPLVLLLGLWVGSYRWTPVFVWKEWYIAVDRGAAFVSPTNEDEANGFIFVPSPPYRIEELLGDNAKQWIPVRRLPFRKSHLYIIQFWPPTVMAAALVLWQKPWRRSAKDGRGFEVQSKVGEPIK